MEWERRAGRYRGEPKEREWEEPLGNGEMGRTIGNRKGRAAQGSR
jgi:hypothetical protein